MFFSGYFRTLADLKESLLYMRYTKPFPYVYE